MSKLQRNQVAMDVPIARLSLLETIEGHPYWSDSQALRLWAEADAKVTVDVYAYLEPTVGGPWFLDVLSPRYRRRSGFVTSRVQGVRRGDDGTLFVRTNNSLYRLTHVEAEAS